MLATSYVRTDGAVHFANRPGADFQLDATDCATIGEVGGADSAFGGMSRDEAALWRREAELALHNGEPKLALRTWRIVRQLQPDAPDVLFHIGCCHALIGEPGQAFLSFQALVQSPEAPRGLRRRAARLAALVDPLAA